MKREARATARANIALAKYWGKADAALNLPAVPSVSMTLDPLLTQTRVSFAEGLASDSFLLGGKFAEPEETARVTKLLDRVRTHDGTLPVVVMTGWGSIETAVEAMRRGARSFVQKPWDDLTLVRLDPPAGFLERSSMLSNRLWEHERTIEPVAGGCTVTDRIAFEPRLPIPGRLLLPLYRTVFRHRHRRLRSRFGGHLESVS